MNNQSSDDNNLLNFIAATVETLRDQMATKDDLASLRDQMATKDDLASLRDQVEFIGGRVETIRDQMATKNDLARLEDRLFVETTAIRGDLEQVHLRLDSINRTLSTRLSQIETDMSRLRSVVYLLVKDKPDMLRLLGSEPPPS
jgi:hypothetical protein